jgi:hypothetical protein
LNEKGRFPDHHRLVISSVLSIHDSKQRNIESLEDSNRIKRSSCDVDPDISKMTDNLLTNMDRAIVHQRDGIFVSKLIGTSQIAKIGKMNHVDILTPNFPFANGFARAFYMKSAQEPSSRFVNFCPIARTS